MSALGLSIRDFVLGENYTVRLFDGGFEVWQQEEKATVRWEDVRALFVSEHGQRYEIHLKNDRVFTFQENKSVLRSKVEWSLAHDRLHLELEYYLIQHKLPTLLTQLAAGATLDFGDLKINPFGLQVGEKHLKWDKFSTLAYDEHVYGTKKQNPTPVQIYQHDTTRLWHSFTWSDIPNVAVLFNLLEQITHLRLWENQWDVALAERHKTNDSGVRHTLTFKDDGQRKQALKTDYRDLKWLAVVGWVILIAIPVMALLDINWVEGWMLVAWCQSLICIAPFGLYAYIHERRSANRDFKYSTREIELSPERLKIWRGDGQEREFRWRDVQYMESNLWFDGTTWLVGMILPFLFFSTSADPLDDEAGHAVDEHLSPEARALMGKTLLRLAVAKMLVRAKNGESIEIEEYRLDRNGIRSEEEFISWDDLRAKSTPSSTILPEWAHMSRDDTAASEYYAVVRHYVYH